MSGKKKDYRAVLKEILDLLQSSIAVRRVTFDFERAVWTVFRELLPDIALQGCLFHWTQALWRKVLINLVTSRVPPSVHPNPTCLRREAVQDPAKEIPATPGMCLQTLGRLQQQRDFSSAVVETMQLPKRTSWEILRCASLFTLIEVYI